VIDEPPHARTNRRDSMGVGVTGFHFGKRRAGATFDRDADDRTMRPTTADTLVAHEEKDAIYYPEANAGVAAQMRDTADTTLGSAQSLPPQNQEALSRRITQTPDTTVNLNLDTDYPVHLYDDYDSDNGNNNADNEILEVPRGHAVFRRMSGSSLVSDPVLRMAEIPKRLSSTPPPIISPRPSILLPIFPSPNIPLSYPPPGSRSRPRTAPSGFTNPSPLASVPPSRPGTGDSAIRHHRLDSIRSTAIPHGHVQGHRTPPTRESSPSRSVRFVDNVDGESGHVGGSSGNGTDDESATVRGYPSPV